MKVGNFYMRSEEKAQGDVLYLGGELDLSAAQEFRAAVERAARFSERNLTLNLKDLRYIDSTGIGIIISVLKMRYQSKAPLTIEEIPPKVQRLFDLTGISKFITMLHEV